MQRADGAGVWGEAGATELSEGAIEPGAIAESLASNPDCSTPPPTTVKRGGLRGSARLTAAATWTKSPGDRSTLSRSTVPTCDPACIIAPKACAALCPAACGSCVTASWSLLTTTGAMTCNGGRRAA